MRQPNDLSRSLATFDPESTLIAVIEMSQSSWLVAAIVPGLERHPLTKLTVDEGSLLRLLQRWRDEAIRLGGKVERIAVAFEAGRDGFWLARWLGRHDIEAYVIHPTSIPVKRDHRRAKTDRLDTELLKRAFLGWLRGEAEHCSMAAIPTIEEEDAKRPHRERESRVAERTRIVNRMKGVSGAAGHPWLQSETCARQPKLLDDTTHPRGRPLAAECPGGDAARSGPATFRRRPDQGDRDGPLGKARTRRLDEKSHPMVRLLARIIGVGLETADMLVAEVLSRNLRDRRAVARYAGLTGAPDESGSQTSGEGTCAGGQRASAARHDPTGVAVPDVPEGKRARPMVSSAHRRCHAGARKTIDRRHGAQAADRLMAFREDRRDIGWGRDAPSLKPPK